jgi:hypothetical protein
MATLPAIPSMKDQRRVIQYPKAFSDFNDGGDDSIPRWSGV